MKDCSLGFCCQGLKNRRVLKYTAEMFYAACRADDQFTRLEDFYLSMFTFHHEELKSHVERTGSTAKFPGACWSEFLWFDIDRESLEEARRAAMALLNVVVAGKNPLVPRWSDVFLFFSGKKGFHVGIPRMAFGDDIEPSPDFYRACRGAAEVARLANAAIDTAIYDKVRLFRCPNTRHLGTGLYKIPVAFDELSKGMSGILERAQTPRRVVSQQAGSPLFVERITPDDVPFTALEIPSSRSIWPKEKILFSLSEKNVYSGEVPELVTRPGIEVPLLRQATIAFIREGARGVESGRHDCFRRWRIVVGVAGRKVPYGRCFPMLPVKRGFPSVKLKKPSVKD